MGNKEMFLAILNDPIDRQTLEKILVIMILNSKSLSFFFVE